MTTRRILVLLSVLAMLGCADVGALEGAPDEELGVSQESLRGRPALPAEVMRLLRSRRELTDEELDRVYEIDHYVRVGRGRRVHLTEHFSIRSWVQWHRRGALLLPGTVVTGSFYDLDVDGYRFAEDLAREGFFVFAMDYEGTGESTYPDNGLDATHEYLLASSRRVLRYIRRVRWIRRVDAIGESNGGAIAAELCSDSRRVRSCVLSSMIYRQGTPFFEAAFQDPGFLAYLASQPDGYLDVTAPLYFNITSRTTPEVSAEILATQPGVYAVAPLLAASSIPWFDPTHAAVPALIIQGTEDNIAAQEDSDLLAADYGSATHGGSAVVLRIDGGGHIPRIEAATRAIWSEAVIDFLTH